MDPRLAKNDAPYKEVHYACDEEVDSLSKLRISCRTRYIIHPEGPHCLIGKSRFRPGLSEATAIQTGAS